MATGIRALHCPNCGARLRWNGKVAVVECRYCETHVAVDGGKPTDRPTEAVSVKIPRRTIAMIAAVCGVVLVGVGAMAVSSRPASGVAESDGPAVTSTGMEIGATSLAGTAEEVAARHHVAVQGEGNLVVVMLSDTAIEQVEFSWDVEHPDHVREVRMRLRAEVDTTAMVTRAQAQLGRRLRFGSSDSAQFSGLAGAMTLGASTLSIRTSSFDNPNWQSGLAGLWSVLCHAAFETPLILEEATRRDTLDLGYPLETLLEVAFDTEVTGAEAVVHALAPNARTDGARQSLMIAHPWFETASLHWENKAGGQWRSVALYFPAELSLSALAEPLTTCLAPVVGEPKKLVTDHLAGTFTLQYKASGGKPWLDIGAQVVQIYPHYSFGDPATADGFSEVISALAGCGR